jgi:hypothetical protein
MVLKNTYQESLQFRVKQLQALESFRKRSELDDVPADFKGEEWFTFLGGGRGCYCSKCNHRPVQRGETVTRVFPESDGSLEVMTYDCFQKYFLPKDILNPDQSQPSR